MGRTDRTPLKPAARHTEKEVTVNNAATPRNPATGSFFSFLYDPPKPKDRPPTTGTRATVDAKNANLDTPGEPGQAPNPASR